MKHCREEEWDAGIGGNCVLYDMNCCKSDKIWSSSTLVNDAIFNTDCTRLIFWDGRKELVCFALDKEEIAPMWIEDLTGYDITDFEVDRTEANSRFLVYSADDYRLRIRRLDDFSEVAVIEFDDETVEICKFRGKITERFLFAKSSDCRILLLDFARLVSEAHNNQEYERCHALEKLPHSSLEFHETTEDYNFGKFLREDKMVPLVRMRKRVLIEDSNRVEHNTKLIFKDLTVGSPKRIVSRDNEVVCNAEDEYAHVGFHRFQEIVEGVGIFEEDVYQTKGSMVARWL